MEAIVIRQVEESDAEQFLAMRSRLFSETDFMLIESDELPRDAAAQRARLAALLKLKNSVILVADAGSKLAGFLYAGGGEFRRNAHSAHLAVGVLEEFQRQGIARQLFAALEAWAPGAGITRLELTVMTHNRTAIELYAKLGFVREGAKRQSLMVNGRAVDEICMAKLL